MPPGPVVLRTCVSSRSSSVARLQPPAAAFLAQSQSGTPHTHARTHIHTRACGTNKKPGTTRTRAHALVPSPNEMNGPRPAPAHQSNQATHTYRHIHTQCYISATATSYTLPSTQAASTTPGTAAAAAFGTPPISNAGPLAHSITALGPCHALRPIALSPRPTGTTRRPPPLGHRCPAPSLMDGSPNAHTRMALVWAGYLQPHTPRPSLHHRDHRRGVADAGVGGCRTLARLVVLREGDAVPKRAVLQHLRGRGRCVC